MNITITLPLDDPYRMREAAAELLEAAERLGLSQSALAAARSHCAEQAWPGADIGPPDTVTDAPVPPVTIATLVMDPTALSKAPEPTPLNAAEAFARTPPPNPGSVPMVPTTAAAAPPPPPVPPPMPAPDAELDLKGNPWIQGVHADNKSKKQDGTWKSRRGAGKVPATNRADGGPAIDDVDLKTFQAAMGKLVVAAGPEIYAVITAAVSQTVFGDMGRTTGGIEHILAADDAKVTGKAFNALKAIAIQTGHGSAF